MDEKAVQAVRTKKNSSMHVGLRLVKEQRAVGFCTAGNTGAAMAAAKMVLGALPGVDRPALASVFPTSAGRLKPSILIDVGANVDSKPHNLAQFALCLLYTSDAADDMQCVDLGGRRIIKKIHI